MKDWQPDISKGGAPVYERLVTALEGDVRDGRLVPGDRLPPQRDLAHRLSLSVGTVSRAYVEAERPGVVRRRPREAAFVTA